MFVWFAGIEEQISINPQYQKGNFQVSFKKEPVAQINRTLFDVQRFFISPQSDSTFISIASVLLSGTIATFFYRNATASF